MFRKLFFLKISLVAVFTLPLWGFQSPRFSLANKSLKIEWFDLARDEYLALHWFPAAHLHNKNPYILEKVNERGRFLFLIPDELSKRWKDSVEQERTLTQEKERQERTKPFTQSINPEPEEEILNPFIVSTQNKCEKMQHSCFNFLYNQKLRAHKGLCHAFEGYKNKKEEFQKFFETIDVREKNIQAEKARYKKYSPAAIALVSYYDFLKKQKKKKRYPTKKNADTDSLVPITTFATRHDSLLNLARLKH